MMQQLHREEAIRVRGSRVRLLNLAAANETPHASENQVASSV